MTEQPSQVEREKLATAGGVVTQQRMTWRERLGLIPWWAGVGLIVSLALLQAGARDPEEPLEPDELERMLRIAGALSIGLTLFGVLMHAGFRVKDRPVARVALQRGVVGGIVCLQGLFHVLFRYVIAGSWRTAWQQSAGMVVMMTGMGISFGLLAWGWTRRVGTSRHCAACEYEYNFTNEEAPAKCPECGAAWLRTLKVGRRERSPRRVVWGVVCLLLTLGLSFDVVPAVVGSGWLGNGVLKAMATVAPKTYWVYQELETRKLTTAEADAWAELVLNIRLADHEGESFGVNWLRAGLALGKFSPSVVERCERESVLPRLATVRAGKAGSMVPVMVWSKTRSELVPTRIAIRGYRVDGGEASGAVNRWIPDLEFGWYSLRYAPNPTRAEVRLPLKPGRCTVSVTVDVITGSAGVGGALGLDAPLMRDAEGNITGLPAGIKVRTVILTRDIDVTP